MPYDLLDELFKDEDAKIGDEENLSEAFIEILHTTDTDEKIEDTLDKGHFITGGM